MNRPVRNKLIAGMLAIVVGFGANISWQNDHDHLAYIPNISMGMQEVDAKFRSGGFSSRSISVRSYSSRSSSATKAKSKTATKTVTTQPKKVQEKSVFTKAAQRTQARRQATAETAKFSRTASKDVTSKAISNSSFKGKLRSVDRSSYYDRRDSTIKRYASNSGVPQTVVYQGAPSYGVFDSWFMWYVVLNDPLFGHNHQNDPGYQEWREDARQLSSENEELRKMLAEHERQLAAIDKPVNPDYVPDEMEGNSDLMFAPVAVEETRPVVKVCTGRSDGTYFQAVTNFDMLTNEVKLRGIPTNGSVQNLQMLQNGECDMALVQRDAYLTYDKENPNSGLELQRIGDLYNEYTHLYCSTESDVYHLSDLKGRTDMMMFVGDTGSGAAVTWDNFKEAYDGLDDIKTLNRTLIAETSPNYCGLYVGHVDSKFISKIPRDEMRLVDIEEVSAKVIKDPEGKNVYDKHTISSDTYGIQHGWWDTGMFSSTPTLTTPVDMVVSQQWVDSVDSEVSDEIVEEIKNVKTAVATALR